MGLKATSICVTLGDRRIIENVSIDVSAGEIVCLLGPNGAGKTTLVRALCGLVPHDGSVTWKGRDLQLTDAGARARTVAYVPQGHTAHWPLDARRIVAIGRFPHVSSLTRLGTADEEAIDRALQQADAIEFSDRDITTLSGGERARVMLARALAVEAPVLLADEPIAALDAAHQIAMAELMVNLARAGRAILTVIHDLSLASRFADRVIVMDEGRIAAIGPPADVLTPDLLADVFQIEAKSIANGGANAIVPWRTLKRDQLKRPTS